MSTTEARFFADPQVCTLPPFAPCYLERVADREVLAALLRGESCHLFAPRMSGKSSLLVRTATCLRAQGRRVAAVDAFSLGRTDDAEHALAGLACMLAVRLGDEEVADAVSSAPEARMTADRFVALMQGVGQRPPPGPCVLIVEDVLEHMRSFPGPWAGLLAALERLLDGGSHGDPAGSFTFCWLNAQTPDLVWPQEQGLPAVFGREIELADFSREELAPWWAGLTAEGRCDTAGADALLDRIHHWTAGHPALSMEVASALERTLSGEHRPDPPRSAGPHPDSLVDELVQRLFLSRPAGGPASEALHYLEGYMARAFEGSPRTLAIYRDLLAGRHETGTDDAEPLSRLRVSGLVAGREGHWYVRNRIFASVLGLEWLEQVETRLRLKP